MKKILTKRITKKQIYKAETVTIMRGWFSRLYQLAQRYEKEPTDENKALLLGYISSAKFIIDKF